MPSLVIEYDTEEELRKRLEKELENMDAAPTMQDTARKLAGHIRATLDGVGRLRRSVCPSGTPCFCPNLDSGKGGECQGGGTCEAAARAAYDYAWKQVAPDWLGKAIALVGLSPEHVLRFYDEYDYRYSVGTLCSRLEEVLERADALAS